MELLELSHLARPRRLARSPEPEKIPTKTCRTCKRAKPLETAFANHHRSKDGHRHDCRCCVKSGKARRPRDMAANTRRQRAARKRNPAVQALNRRAVREWSRRNPAANRARNHLRYAVKSGKVKKPSRCEFKGCARTKLEAHHPDYSKPLTVLWGCRSHHRRLHSGERLPLKAGISSRLTRIPKEAVA